MTTKKTISVRPSDAQYAIISRLCELTGKSRNAFFQEILDQAEPALQQMLDVLDQANRYSNPGERIGAALGAAAGQVSKVSKLIEDERQELARHLGQEH